MTTRKPNKGQFKKGNKGGPGRPSRAIERAYMRALGESVSLDDWRAIVLQAVNDAKQGAPHARVWLSNYLLGPSPVSLQELAAADLLYDDETLVEGHAKMLAAGPPLFAAGPEFGPDDYAMQIVSARENENE